jgi:nicotinamidase-related amidase
MSQIVHQPQSNSALLVIDTQDSFKATPRWERRSNPNFEKNVATLIDAFRAAGRPVFFVMHNEPDSEYFKKSSPHYRLMDFIAPQAGEPIVHKTTINAFTSTDLLPMLLRAGVGHVVITGIQTEQCCETSARVGSDLGLEVDFVTEATLTFPIAKSLEPGSEELPVEAIIERTEYALRRRFARIMTVAEVVAELGVSVAA